MKVHFEGSEKLEPGVNVGTASKAKLKSRHSFGTKMNGELKEKAEDHRRDCTCGQHCTKSYARATISRAVTAGFVDESAMDEDNDEQDQRVNLMKLKLQGYVTSNAFLRRTSSKPRKDRLSEQDRLPVIQTTGHLVSQAAAGSLRSSKEDNNNNKGVEPTNADSGFGSETGSDLHDGIDSRHTVNDGSRHGEGDVQDSDERYKATVTGTERKAPDVDILDSDEFDTDLEQDEHFGTDSPITDAALGVTRYIRECERGQLPVQQEVVHGLQRRVLSLRNRSLGSAHVRALCAALKDNVRVESVNLHGTDVGEDGIQAVAQMMLENTSITRMNISNNKLGIRGAQVLGHVMVVTEHLTHLNLSGNTLGDDAAWYFSSAFESNESITHLDLSYNELGEQGGVVLATGLAQNKGLVYLNLSWNKLVGKGCVGIFRALMINTTLVTLNFAWNGMGYEGAVALSKCLRQNESLRDIDVSSNRLNPQGAHLIAEGLHFNSTLAKLRIGFNPLSTTGCMDILNATKLPYCNINLLDCSEVPVVGEADLLSATISRQRNFTFIHGGIVPTHDKLGERLGREINPMLRIIEYLRLLGLRPLELMRSFDRTTTFEVPRGDFVEQIKKIGVKLHHFEIEALANSISSKGTNKNIINYRKLCVAVREVVLKERERKQRERTERAQMRTYHKQILKKGTLQDSYKTSSRPGSGPDSRHSLSKMSSQLTQSMTTHRSSDSPSGKVQLSLSSPLGSSSSLLTPAISKRSSVFNNATKRA